MNRYRDEPEESTEEEDARFQEWMTLTEEEQDAEVNKAVAEHEEVWRKLTVAQQVRHLRRRALGSCISNRKCAKQFPEMDVFTKGLRSAQIRLLKLREFRKTGIYPGGTQ